MELLPGFEPGTSSLPMAGHVGNFVDMWTNPATARVICPNFIPYISSAAQVTGVVVPVTVSP